MSENKNTLPTTTPSDDVEHHRISLQLAYMAQH